MDQPVHHYRGYEILCSQTGYTVMKGGAEILNVGAADANPSVTTSPSMERLLIHARRKIDQLIAEAPPESGGAG
jgi:hypothetical protein